MFKAAEKMSHPRLGHRLKYWFLLDLVSQEHMPLHILGLCFPLGAGAWEDLREAWVRGGGKHLCNTQVTLPCSQWRVLPVVPDSGIFSDLLFSIPNSKSSSSYPLWTCYPNRGSHSRKVPILNLLSFPNFNFSPSFSPPSNNVFLSLTFSFPSVQVRTLRYKSSYNQCYH